MLSCLQWLPIPADRDAIDGASHLPQYPTFEGYGDVPPLVGIDGDPNLAGCSASAGQATKPYRLRRRETTTRAIALTTTTWHFYPSCHLSLKSLVKPVAVRHAVAHA